MTPRDAGARGCSRDHRGPRRAGGRMTRAVAAAGATLRALGFAAVTAAPVVARGQPAEPPGAAAGGQGSAGQLQVPTPVDEARIRELVDRELARVLTERAAKEAAERAAKETADREAAATEAPGE